MRSPAPQDDPFLPRIATERLVLRPLDPADADALFAIFSDPAVMKYWNTPPWPSVDTAARFIAERREEMTRQAAITLGICLQAEEEGPPIGQCMLFAIDRASRRAEIGFGLGRGHWGQGYIGEAGRALIAHGFDRLGLRRIEAEIDPDNSASAQALERLGFTREGLLRQRWEIDGVVSDSALYGLLARDR